MSRWLRMCSVPGSSGKILSTNNYKSAQMEVLSTDSQEVVLGCNTLFWDLIVGECWLKPLL